MKCDMLESENVGHKQIIRCETFTSCLCWWYVSYWQGFCLNDYPWPVSPQCHPHLWLPARQWRNCSKPSPLPLASELSLWTWKNRIFFWRHSWKNRVQSAGRWRPFAGSWKTSGLWPRVTSRRRLSATESVSRARESWRASRPYCLYCIYERWGGRWTQDHIVVRSSMSHVCLVSHSVWYLKCYIIDVFVVTPIFFFLLQGSGGSLCIRPCLLPHADYSGTPHLLNLKPGTPENCNPALYMD